MKPSSNTLSACGLAGAVLAVAMLAAGPAAAEWRAHAFFHPFHGPVVIEIPPFGDPDADPYYDETGRDEVVVLGPDDAPHVDRSLLLPPGAEGDRGPAVVPSVVPRSGPKIVSMGRRDTQVLAAAEPVRLPVPRPNLEGIDFDEPAALVRPITPDSTRR